MASSTLSTDSAIISSNNVAPRCERGALQGEMGPVFMASDYRKRLWVPLDMPTSGQPIETSGRASVLLSNAVAKSAAEFEPSLLGQTPCLEQPMELLSLAGVASLLACWQDGTCGEPLNLHQISTSHVRCSSWLRESLMHGAAQLRAKPMPRQHSTQLPGRTVARMVTSR